VAVLDRLQHLAQQAAAAPSLAQEGAIVSAAEHLPRDYQSAIRPRIDRARKCLGAVRGLNDIVSAGRGEAAIVAAWRLVVQAQGDRLVPAEVRHRVDAALDRMPILESLLSIPRDATQAERDRKLLAAWREDVLDGCPEADPWRAEHEAAVRRRDLLKRLDEAIQRNHEALVAQLTDDPLLAGYPMPAAWTEAIRGARDRMTRLQAFLDALNSGDREAFARAFDVRLVRQYPDRFQAWQQRLCDWARQEVLWPERMGLRPAIARASVACIDRGDRTFRLRWTWPPPRFGDECIVAVCREVPHDDEDPREVDSLHRLAVDRRAWESGGGSRVLRAEADWLGAHVVVWMTVDLGFRLFFSRPLDLGTLGESRRRAAAKAGDRWEWFSRLGKKGGAKGKTAAAEPAEADPPAPAANEEPDG
jgi:hypothetical protein